MMKYVDIPKVTTYKEVVDKEYSLSASQHKKFNIPNKNVVFVRNFLSRGLTNDDLGTEVGSSSYFDAGPKQFIKAGALQPESYLLDINKESVKNIIPQSFVSMNLKKGDVIVSKDSNVGEVVILDKDYPNAMLSGALYRLPIKEHKYYLLAMMKSDLFREQIDFMVPRGATIRHGKTKFLDAKIPLPNKRKDETINYVEQITKAIIEKEYLIHCRFDKLLSVIHKELLNNQNPSKYVFSYPTISELIRADRIDTSIFSNEFKRKEFLIINYKYGYKSLDDLEYKGIRGTSLETNFIKNRIDSTEYHKGFYELVIPTNITKYGTVAKSTFIGTTAKLKTISQGDIIFGGEGFGKGKSYVVIDNVKNIATNYHGIRIVNTNRKSLDENIFIKSCLSYLREMGLIDCYGVGGNGGHFAPAYFHYAKIPTFPDNIKNKVVSLYYSKSPEYNPSKCDINNFYAFDDAYNKTAGIYELDKSMRYLRDKLKQAIEDIACDREVKCKF